MKNTRFRFGFPSFSLCCLILIGILGYNVAALAQGAGSGPGSSNCGVFKKLGTLSPDNSGPIYYDRFGNIWTEFEIVSLGSNVVETCDAGVFKLSFSGTYTAARRDQVCAALSGLSGVVGGTAPTGIVPLKIEFIGDVDGNGAAASHFM